MKIIKYIGDIMDSILNKTGKNKTGEDYQTYIVPNCHKKSKNLKKIIKVNEKVY